MDMGIRSGSQLIESPRREEKEKSFGASEPKSERESVEKNPVTSSIVRRATRRSKVH